MANASLQSAKQVKNDEFYTQFSDIKTECDKYARAFRDTVIYCNCDDHYGISKGTPKSNFIKYFADNFQAFGLKGLIATHYEKDGSNSCAYILDRDITGDGIICLEDIEEIPLRGDGDFRSDECINFLKQADIVITNPPFSLFREYVAQLMEYNKKFLIIGNKNAFTYKEIFPLIQDNKMWLGTSVANMFGLPDGTISNQQNGLTRWFTNLPNARRNEWLNTGAEYTGHESEYPKYDNYDAIEVSKVSHIPMDYDGVMGVPITFLDKHNPEQFEIVGATESEGKGFSNGLWLGGVAQARINGKRVFKRLFIKKTKK